MFKVISGGQSGVDIAALKAAKAAGLEVGGWMPKGWLTEDGPRPEYAELYGMREMSTADYPSRTRQNIEEADGTLLLLDRPPPLITGGTALTMRLARESGKPCRPVVVGVGMSAIRFALNWLTVTEGKGIRTLNVAGPRESKAFGIGAAAEAFLVELFRLLKEGA